MDDGSTDGTPEIVASYGDRVRYVRQPATRGIYGNANDGIERSRAGSSSASSTPTTSTYPRLVEREVDWLRAHPDAGAVFCSDVFVDADGREFGRLELPPRLRGNRAARLPGVLNALLTLQEHVPPCPTALVRASVYRELGGYGESSSRTRPTSRCGCGSRARTRSACSRSICCSTAGPRQLVRALPPASHRPGPVLRDHGPGARRAGGRAWRRPTALRAYEAHRAEDALMRAVSHYILGERSQASAVLGEVRAAAPRGEPADPARPTARAGARAARCSSAYRASTAVARLFDRRWHSGSGATLRVPPDVRHRRRGFGRAGRRRSSSRRMRDRLTHRGPDAAGLWSTADRRVCLGHRRLAIVDLSPEANQPFLSADGRHAIVLNGEIYNFRALREELEAAGAHVPHELGHRGAARGVPPLGRGVPRPPLRACSRSRSGTRSGAGSSVPATAPARSRSTTRSSATSFLFASELKSLLLWPGFRRELDYTALADFLTFGFVPDPKSIWQGAAKLPPGHALTVELGEGGPRVGEPTPYWDLALDPDHVGRRLGAGDPRRARARRRARCRSRTSRSAHS